MNSRGFDNHRRIQEAQKETGFKQYLGVGPEYKKEVKLQSMAADTGVYRWLYIGKPRKGVALREYQQLF